MTQIARTAFVCVFTCMYVCVPHIMRVYVWWGLRVFVCAYVSVSRDTRGDRRSGVTGLLQTPIIRETFL